MSSDGLQILLSGIGHHLRDHGRWPTFGELDRQIDREDGLDAAELLRVAPVNLVLGDRRWAGTRSDATFGLTVLGLCAAGRVAEAELLVRAVAWLVDEERADTGEHDGNVTRTGDAIAEALGLAEPTRSRELSCLYSMMSSAPEIWSSLSGEGDSWSVTIKRDIRRYRGVVSVRSYLDRMDRASAHADSDERAATPDLGLLLDKVEELRLLALPLQADQVADPPPTSLADVLVERYQRWYASALAHLPPDLVDRFRGEYEGSSFTNKIRRFLEEPLATNDEAKAFFAQPNGPPLPIGHWRNPVDKTFLGPLRAQALILREAQARATSSSSSDNTPDLLLRCLERVGQLVRELTRRRAGREPFAVRDEHDLQDVVRGLLRVLFDDVRAEDPLPIYAGGSSRVDFVIPEIGTLLELKIVNQRGRDRSIGEELLVDAGRYRAAHPNYRRLVALIYDPDRLLDNASGLQADLTRREGELDVVVVVAH